MARRFLKDKGPNLMPDLGRRKPLRHSSIGKPLSSRLHDIRNTLSKPAKPSLETQRLIKELTAEIQHLPLSQERIQAEKELAAIQKRKAALLREL